MAKATSPPNLRLSHDDRHCGSCKMYDAEQAVCWGYGNYPVEPNLVCDSWVEDPERVSDASTDSA